MTVPYAEMLPDRLYQYDGHLFIVRECRYFRLPLDHFSGKFILPWQDMNRYEMEAAKLQLVTVGHLPQGVRVERDRQGQPVRFKVKIAGR